MAKTNKLDKLYDRFRRGDERDRFENLDAILQEVALQALGSSGVKAQYQINDNLSAFGPDTGSTVEEDYRLLGDPVRAVFDHKARAISMVATIENAYSATLALRALVADPNAREYGYGIHVHLVLLSHRPTLLEGRPYPKLLTLFHTPPEHVWVIGGSGKEVTRANHYIRNPDLLKQAIIENMVFELEQACIAPAPANDTLNFYPRANKLAPFAKAFTGLLFFAKDKSENAAWTKPVLAPFLKFQKLFPDEALEFELDTLETRLLKPFTSKNKPSSSYKTTNDPSLLTKG